MNSLKIKNEEIIFSFSKLNEYDDLEFIEAKLQTFFNIVILKKLDGPDMRIWDFNIDDKKYQLYNDPYGNYLITNVGNKQELENIVNKADF